MKKKISGICMAGIATFAFSLSQAEAVFINIIDTAGGGNFGTDNVLFNNTDLDSGLLVQGSFNSAPGFLVNFTSTGGNLVGNGGQSRIEGGEGNSPFTNLTFSLENGATFTTAILNPDATNAGNMSEGGDTSENGDGFITFTVNYLSPGGVFDSDQFTLKGAGQNFFRIEAGMGAVISSVTLDVTDTSLVDSGQFRLGGFAPAASVPDGGLSVALLGLAVTGLGLFGKFSRRAEKPL